MNLDTVHLNQHFLISQESVDVLIEAACIGSDEIVLEIGPGLGILTTNLACRARKVIAVELDPQLFEKLKGITKNLKNVRIILGNALEVDLPAFDKIVANLPFSIIEPFIERLKKLNFKKAALITGARFARIATAQLGDKEFGKLSLLTQCYFQVEVIQIVSPTSFSPMPRVQSSIIVLNPLSKAQLLSTPALYIMSELFEQRDKIIKNALREGLIRYAQAIGKTTTKNEARTIITNILTEEPFLSSFLENLNNQQINSIYQALKLLR